MLPAPCPGLLRALPVWPSDRLSVRLSIRGTSGIGLDLFQRKHECEPGASVTTASESPAQHFNALSHSTEAVAFRMQAATAVVFDFKPARSILLFKFQPTRPGVCVTHNICDSLAHRQGKNAFLYRRQLESGRGVAFNQMPAVSRVDFACASSASSPCER